jgi:hypothetical protein
MIYSFYNSASILTVASSLCPPKCDRTLASPADSPLDTVKVPLISLSVVLVADMSVAAPVLLPFDVTAVNVPAAENVNEALALLTTLKG